MSVFLWGHKFRSYVLEMLTEKIPENTHPSASLGLLGLGTLFGTGVLLFAGVLLPFRHTHKHRGQQGSGSVGRLLVG